MNAASILAALKALLPALEPLALQEFENAIMPALKNWEAGAITSPDLKVIADAMDTAIEAIAAAEIPKIGQ